MSLTVVSTPIGNPGDITLRAVETLKTADVIICEELKPGRAFLKSIGLPPSKEMRQLNEHSKPEDVAELVEICATQNVALISDCGTPGFCDPGADLVEACRQRGLAVNTNPGASSLMAIISLSGVRLKEFHFVGFLPAEREQRSRKIAELKILKVPFVVMDTPYRLKATLEDLARDFADTQAVVGADLTGEKQVVLKGRLSELASKDWEKQPFVVLVLPPTTEAQTRLLQRTRRGR